MQQRFSFDADDIIRQLREAADRDYAKVMASVTCALTRAAIEAQHALFPAQETFARVHIGLREAGRDERFIARTAGTLAGSILVDLLLNAEDRAAVMTAFFSTVVATVNGDRIITRSDVSVEGRPMGEA